MTTALAGVEMDQVLTDEMLARFDERAAGYDRDNRFFDEDWAELRDSGYLNVAIPETFGGPGLRLAEVMKLQRQPRPRHRLRRSPALGLRCATRRSSS